MTNTDLLKEEILRLTAQYSKEVHSKFRPGTDKNRAQWQIGDPIPYAGRVFSEDEVLAAVSTTLDFWLTLGSEGQNMEKEISEFFKEFDLLLLPSAQVPPFDLSNEWVKEINGEKLETYIDWMSVCCMISTN